MSCSAGPRDSGSSTSCGPTDRAPCLRICRSSPSPWIPAPGVQRFELIGIEPDREHLSAGRAGRIRRQRLVAGGLGLLPVLPQSLWTDLSQATTLLPGSYSDSTGRALLTAVAQAARLAAATAVDVGRPALAQRYYIQALNLAMHAGNRLLAASVLFNMSAVTILNAAGARCARRAVALARAGLTVAGTATPTLAAQLSAAQARGHALCQDSAASRTAVLEAQRHYERFHPDGEPAWLSFYTEAELAADLWRALRDSGEPAPAIQLMTRTLDSYEPWRMRSRCLVQTDLAATYLVDGDHEHAAALTRDALNTAGTVSSSRTVSRIQALQQQIRPLHSAGLAELDDEITGFLRRVHDDEGITP